MRTIRGKVVVVLGTVVLAGALTGILSACADTGSAGSGAVASPTSEPPTARPSPSATPDAATVERITVTSSGLDIHSSDGSTATFGYFDPTQNIVDALTTAFGGAPEVEAYHPNLEPGPSTLYTWPGLVLNDPDAPMSNPLQPEYSVSVSAPEINGVRLETVDGIHVGSAAPALEAAYPETSNRVTVWDQPERLDVMVDSVNLPPTADTSGDLTYSVWLIAPDPAGAITELRAPSGNFGL